MPDDFAAEAERAEQARELRLSHASERKRKRSYAGRMQRSLARQRAAAPPPSAE